MGAGQSRNLFQAAKDNELQRAIYFIEHDKEDINVKDKVREHSRC
jgi:DhnA family fructose-bisphosphate aldolase class Ia